MGCLVGLTKAIFNVFSVKSFSLIKPYLCKCLSKQGNYDSESFPAVRCTVKCVCMVDISYVFLLNLYKKKGNLR